MSRIEEALRRARAVEPTATLEESSAPAEPEAPWGPLSNREDRLDSPWTFESSRPRPTGGDGPATGLSHHADSARPASGPMAPSLPAGDAAPLPDTRRRRALFNGFDPVVEARIVGSREVPPVSVEQYRRLAATLHHVQVDRGIKVVLVTSAVPGEGKSLTSTNLALTLSQSYRRRVLLIDGDLRRPSIARIFQLNNPFGLSDALKADDERKLSIVEVSEHLAILTAGKPDPDPMGSLTSDRMRRIIDEAASKFDWVIIDTPPVALLPDASLLAAMAEAAVLVIGAARTPYDVIQRTVDSLGRDKIMGVVLNRADETSVRGGKHYQSYYEAS